VPNPPAKTTRGALLGERGQAKTRIVRSLVALLDEWTPVIEGSELRSHPSEPLPAHARDLGRSS
jgi:magnesium chelatase subunit I